MANFLTYYKSANPNLYSLLVSILLIFWYNGLVGMINYLFPDRGLAISLCLMTIPLLAFWTDDGTLNALYSSGKTPYEINSALDDIEPNRRESFKRHA